MMATAALTSTSIPVNRKYNNVSINVGRYHSEICLYQWLGNKVRVSTEIGKHSKNPSEYIDYLYVLPELYQR